MAWTDVRQLHEAIGGVAVHSAGLDDTMRLALSQMVESEASMSFIQGQGTGWLREACKRILEEVDPKHEWYPKDERARFVAALEDVPKWNELRSWIIHGLFMPAYEAEDEEIQTAVRRPFGNADDGSLLYLCERSKARQSKVATRLFTLSDIVAVGNRMSKTSLDLDTAWWRMQREKERGFAMSVDRLSEILQRETPMSEERKRNEAEG